MAALSLTRFAAALLAQHHPLADPAGVYELYNIDSGKLAQDGQKSPIGAKKSELAMRMP